MIKDIMSMSITVDSQYGRHGCLEEQEEDEGLGEIIKVKIEDEERLLLDIMWAQKPPNISDLQKT